MPSMLRCSSFLLLGLGVLPVLNLATSSPAFLSPLQFEVRKALSGDLIVGPSDTSAFARYSSVACLRSYIARRTGIPVGNIILVADSDPSARPLPDHRLLTEIAGPKLSMIISAPPAPVGPKVVASTIAGFAALGKNGRLVTWGHNDFADPALLNNRYEDEPYGRVHQFVHLLDNPPYSTSAMAGFDTYRGRRRGIEEYQGQIRDVVSNLWGFLVLLEDGGVVTSYKCHSDVPEASERKLATQKAVKIFGGGDFFVVLLEDGELVCWTCGDCKIPSEYQALIKAEQDGVPGENLKFFFGMGAVLLEKSGRVLALGCGSWSCSKPSGGLHQLPSERVVDIKYSSRSFAAMMDSGRVMFWGKNPRDSGFLARSESGVRQLFGFSRGFIAVLQTGEVKQWADVEGSWSINCPAEIIEEMEAKGIKAVVNSELTTSFSQPVSYFAAILGDGELNGLIKHFI